VWNTHGVERVLYRLPELKAAVGKERVYIVEGEKDADAIRAVGGVATTNEGGTGKWKAARQSNWRRRHGWPTSPSG
jgi:hypothetical protein